MKSRRRARILWSVLAAVFAVASAGGPAASAGKGLEQVGQFDAKLSPDARTTPPNFDLIEDSARRRAYQIILTDSKQTFIRQWDLDSMKVVKERELPRAAFPRGPAAPGSLTEWIRAYDPDTATLYLPFLEATAGNFGGIVSIDGDSLKVKRVYPKEIAHVDTTNPGCTSSACLPQQPTATLNITGMSFVPSILSGGQPKVLMLLQDFTIPTAERNFSQPYIAQWDVDSGLQDFIYRVQSCASHKLPALGMYQIGIFQARLTAGIYLGCQAAGGTGQIVRVDLDLNGRPSAEAAFPGPLGVVDIVPDEEADRMMLRVSNTEGQSWWVFDGTSKSYTGVAGVTLGPGKTAAGLDPSSGRLYVMAPPTGTGDQSSGGGLMYTDVRRSPIPQMLATEQFAQPADGRIGIDLNPSTTERRLFVRKAETSQYLVFRDNDPITIDDQVNDQDRLTSDVEEQLNVTGRNYNGSGHAYGVRTLLSGGVNGVTPTGPDTNDVRVGRALMTIAGTPCGPGDREIAIGVVRNAALSNNSSAAAASVGDADPGTKQDVNEPSGRCYPRPQDNSGNDLWNGSGAGGATGYPRPLDTELDDEPTADEGRSDVDELAGSSWPFGPAECSGEGEKKAPTNLTPLDRGDNETGPLSPEQRAAGSRVAGYDAEVGCSQNDARVMALAQLLNREQSAPALEVDVPDIGTLRVGEVSSHVDIYLDKDRGLVARAESTVREISIGDHIYIDKAFTVGEAWAKGRPGSAQTSFFRRLCGVRVKDEAGDVQVFRPVVEPNQSDPTQSTIDPTGGPEVKKDVDVSPCGDLGQQATQNANLDPEKPVIDAINRVLGSRGRVSAPKPDGALSQGSPGGYIASIQKDRLETISGRAVNNDASTQVPALELLVYNDDPTKGRGRQVYQFAGVDASVTYGIYLLNPGGSLPPCFCPPPESGGLFDPPLPTQPPPAQPPLQGPPPHTGPITMLFKGIAFLLRSPKDAALAAAVWMLLYSPLKMSGRRRLLKALA